MFHGTHSIDLSIQEWKVLKIWKKLKRSFQKKKGKDQFIFIIILKRHSTNKWKNLIIKMLLFRELYMVTFEVLKKMCNVYISLIILKVKQEIFLTVCDKSNKFSLCWGMEMIITVNTCFLFAFPFVYSKVCFNNPDGR